MLIISIFPPQMLFYHKTQYSTVINDYELCIRCQYSILRATSISAN